MKFSDQEHLTTVTDEQLNSGAQQCVRRAVRALPAEEPSMAWRSALNQKLIAAAEAKKSRRKFKLGALWSGGVGLVGAAALAMFMTIPESGPRPAGGGRYAMSHDSLVRYHQESGVLISVSGADAAGQTTDLPVDDNFADYFEL